MGAPASPKKLTVATEEAPGLNRMISVVKPPPSTICGMTMGEGAGWFMSATGNVVKRNSPLSFIKDRTVIATKGESLVISTTP